MESRNHGMYKISFDGDMNAFKHGQEISLPDGKYHPLACRKA